MRKTGIVAIVAVGLLAVLQGVQLTSLPLSYSAYPADTAMPRMMIWALALPALASLVLAAFLIGARNQLGDWLFDDTSADTTPIFAQWPQLGLTILGIWLAASAIPRLVTGAVTAATSTLQLQALLGDMGGGATATFWDYLPNLTTPLIELVIGIVLVATSRVVACRLFADCAVGDLTSASSRAPGDVE